MTDRAVVDDFWRCPICKKEITGSNGQWNIVKQPDGLKRPVHVLCIDAQAKEVANAKKKEVRDA